MLVGPTRRGPTSSPNVTLTGQVPDEQLAAIYSGAHALVLPSVDEGFGLPAVEALACGTPVVACEVRRCARCSRTGPRSLTATCGVIVARGRPAPRPAPAAVDLAGRRTRHLGGLRPAARGSNRP